MRVQHLDSSTLVKRYIAEPDSRGALRLMASDLDWVTAAHTEVEIRRTLAIRLAAEPALLASARDAFARDWRRTAVVQLDQVTCRMAADLAELTRARSPDALHLAAAQRAGARAGSRSPPPPSDGPPASWHRCARWAGGSCTTGVGRAAATPTSTPC